MKGFAFVLLCALVAVQARSAAVPKSGAVAAALGENPWLVHLRIAVSTSGLLETCTGSLIDSRWVLTAASCIADSRFIWIRYSAMNVINPELVTENSIVHLYLDQNVGLININRNVESSANIAPVALSTDKLPASAKLCGYGENDGVPGEQLACSEVSLTGEDDVAVSRFDSGAPLVVDGVQVGVLTGVTDGKIDVVAVADVLEWIQEETGIEFNADVVAEIAPEAVRFVN